MAINQVIYGGETLIDLTADSVTPETLAEGVTAHDATGAVIVGVMAASAGKCYQAGDTAPEDTDLLWIDTANGNLVKFHNGTDWEATSAIAVWG